METAYLRVFCFPNYEYVLDVSKQNTLMPDTVSLEQGLQEEFEWYQNNLDSVYKRRQYMEFIDRNIAVRFLADTGNCSG